MMRRLLFTIGFALSLAIAASSFATLMNDDSTSATPAAQQTFFIPQNGAASTNECLADISGCGKAAAASVCESKGFSRVVSFGEAAPEDITGSIGETAKPILKIAKKQDVPVLVVCSR